MNTIDPVPKLFEHATSVYNELAQRARLDNGEIDGTLRFEGSKVEAFRAVKISQMYYTPIFDLLTELGCIEQVRRGTSSQPSVIVLHKPPVLEEFTASHTKVLTKPTPLDTLRQQIEDMRRRLPDIDLNSYILSLDTRLSDLEARLSKIEQGRE